MAQIAFFDVFDTILTRRVGNPEDVFLLLGRALVQEGLISGSAEDFQKARVAAEAAAHATAGTACTLAMIYAAFRDETGQPVSAERRAVLLEHECALEAALIQPVPGAEEQIQAARIAGRKIIFLSDMYLPGEWIQGQLRRCNLFQEGDGCTVSCELGKSKRSGDLFTAVLEREGARPEDAVHTGNDLSGDIQPAARLGLKTHHFAAGNLTRFEQILEKDAVTTGGLTASMAGAARLARLSALQDSAHSPDLHTVAAGVAGPALTAYVLWILNRAGQLGLKRLYFLARDGQVLLEIAQRLRKTLDLDLDLCYLYGSRRAWNLPAILHGSDAELAWFWDTPDLLTVRSLLARAQLQPEQAEDELRKAGLTQGDWDRPLSKPEFQQLQAHLLTPRVRSLIVEEARKERKILVQYLRQEGVLDGIPWGLVDLGWYGSMQNAISAVIEEVGGVLPHGFYFALWKGTVAHQYAALREAYFFDQHQGSGYLEPFEGLIPLMEMFCASDHGTVIRFTEQAGRMVPVLKEVVNQKVVDWGLPQFRETLYGFVDQLMLTPPLVDPWADVRSTVTGVLRTFWYEPTVAEATAWAGFPWEDGLGKETYSKPLAQPYHWQDVLESIGKGRVAPHHRAGWLYGSLMISNGAVRKTLIAVAHFLRFYHSWLWRGRQRLKALNITK